MCWGSLHGPQSLGVPFGSISKLSESKARTRERARGTGPADGRTARGTGHADRRTVGRADGQADGRMGRRAIGLTRGRVWPEKLDLCVCIYIYIYVYGATIQSLMAQGARDRGPDRGDLGRQAAIRRYLGNVVNDRWGGHAPHLCSQGAPRGAIRAAQGRLGTLGSIGAPPEAAHGPPKLGVSHR